MDNELQIGVAALGVAAVVVIVGYNKWQERKHRRQAEMAFRSEHRDVLLEPHEGGGAGERIEPWGGEGSAVPDPVAAEPVAAPRPVREAAGKRGSPPLPDALDARADCIICIESIEPLEAPRLWAAQHEQLDGIAKPVRWFAFDDAENLWRPLTAHSAGAFHWFCGGMQLVDRRGPIGESELMRFSGGIQRIADQFLAVPASLPARAEVLGNATTLDRFCAEVDVQIGINVVSNGQPFAGTKIRGLAESQGLELVDDGSFHARDEQGHTLYTLWNGEPELFTGEGMRALQTSGLTLLIDVPRVANGVAAFDRMMHVAGQLAEALHGTVVDDNRAPFGAEAAGVIRKQIQQFQAHMAEHGVPAGGALARRLFAA